jgi:hypothetical protein
MARSSHRSSAAAELCEPGVVIRQISFTVEGLPPAKNEAKSMLADGHMYAERVLVLLAAARDARPAGAPRPLFGTERLGLDWC